MDKNIKKIFVLLMFLVIITNVSSADFLKPAALNKEYTIFQTCATCSYVNITVSDINGILFYNVPMVDNGSVWTYEMTPTITSRHDVTGVGDKDGTDDGFVTFFEVTPSGKISTTGDSILYSLFTLISFAWICLLSFFIIAIPSDNERDDVGFEGRVVKIKYFRVILVFLLYPSLILMLNFLNGLAVNFTALSMFAGTLGFLFEIMLRLSWIFTVLIIVWIVYMLIHDTNINRQLDKLDKFDPFKPES